MTEKNFHSYFFRIKYIKEDKMGGRLGCLAASFISEITGGIATSVVSVDTAKAAVSI